MVLWSSNVTIRWLPSISVMKLGQYTQTAVVACRWEVMFASDLSSSSTPLKRINLGIIGKAMRNTLPIFILQTVISMLTLIFSEDVDKNSGLPAWFIVSHEVELSGCQHLGSDGTLPSSGWVYKHLAKLTQLGSLYAWSFSFVHIFQGYVDLLKNDNVFPFCVNFLSLLQLFILT